MKLCYKKYWFLVASILSVAFVVYAFVAGMSLRSSLHVGSSIGEVRNYIQAEREHEMRMPPFKIAYGQTCNGTNVWLLGTGIYLRQGRLFGSRCETLNFSSNATVTNISSRWEWRWNL